MLYWMCAKTKIPPTGPQLEHAIKRNFGGLEDSDLNPYEVFMKKIKTIGSKPNFIGVEEVQIMYYNSIMSLYVYRIYR